MIKQFTFNKNSRVVFTFPYTRDGHILYSTINWCGNLLPLWVFYIKFITNLFSNRIKAIWAYSCIEFRFKAYLKIWTWKVKSWLLQILQNLFTVLCQKVSKSKFFLSQNFCQSRNFFLSQNFFQSKNLFLSQNFFQSHNFFLSQNFF